eukprot:m.86315 g.86315  ORF g.86315 m.86315 type:complete len:509 (-) comp13545_c0_seq2:299-1825(-)
MSAAVKEMIARLDAAKLQEAKERAERAKAAEEAARAAAASEQERLRREKEEEEARKKKAAEEEKLKWKVNEEECALDVLARKKAFLDSQRKPEVKKPAAQIKSIPTIVIDLGSGMIKAGFAGEDAPRWMFSSIIGHVQHERMDLEKHAHVKRDFYVGDLVWPFSGLLKIKRVIKRGVVQDWSDFEKLLDFLFYEEMKLTAEQLLEHPVLCSEEPLSPKSNREKVAMLLFEKYKVPAVFFANTSTLAIYSSGNLTGLVIDIGYNVASSVALFDGDVISRTLKRLDVGGADLDVYLAKLLRDRGYKLDPERVFDSFLVRDIKERLCYVSSDFPAEQARMASSAVRSTWSKSTGSSEVEYDVASDGNDQLPGFESRQVPDKLIIGSERFLCSEALFDPEGRLGRDTLLAGVHKMVQESLRGCPIDTVRAMCANVVLAGGTTMMTGFASRVRTELRALLPSSVEITVVDSPTRIYAAWIGGSVLASAHSFNPHWVSRDEYLRYGPDLLHGPL